MGNSREARGSAGRVRCACIPGRDTRRHGFPLCSACVPVSGGAASGSAARLGARADGTARTARHGRARRSARRDVAAWRQLFQLALLHSKTLQNFE
jgi:hypothetical protein